MELIVLVGGLVVLDIVAYFFAHDSREVAAPDHHDLAMSARGEGIWRPTGSSWLSSIARPRASRRCGSS